MKGRFIVFEGIDRSGKSTQCRLLHEKLEHSILVNFPDRTTPIGKMIDLYLKAGYTLDQHAIHLLFSANRWEIASRIQMHLDKGHDVITDRYSYSGIAYSHALGLSLEWCNGPDQGLPTPDLVFYMDISTQLASERSEYGQEIYETHQFQTKVHEAFQKLVRSDWHILDASLSINQLQTQILSIL